MTNPERAVDAILTSESEVGGYTIYPLTVARLACLEKIDSPLLTGKEDYAKTIATVWIMTQKAEDLAKAIFDPEGLQQKAIVWADELSMSDFNDICKRVRDEMGKMAKMVGTDEENKGKKKAPTAG